MERIPDEVIEAYESSESYKTLEILRDEGKKVLTKYFTKYQFQEQYFKEKTEKKLHHYKYAKGRMEVHRGILCPGNMEVLTIGNITKGRFIKNNNNPDFIYGYDKDDTLILSDMLDGNIKTREYIFWENNSTQLGLQYDSLLGLELISEAKYNDQGKILSYLFCDFYNKEVFSLVSESYIYKENKAYVTFIGATGEEYIDGEHIVLFMEEDGLVTKYTRCTDMRPDEVYECVPKYKLIL